MTIARKIFIKTYGCQMNWHDSERIAADLQSAGHIIIKSENDADVFILNTCSVREQAEAKAIGKSGFLARRKKRKRGALLGIVGCMAENLGEDLFRLNSEINFVVGPRRIREIKDILARDRVERVLLLGTSNAEDKFPLNRDISLQRVTAGVSIMQGCNMKCSYCIVPKTRGAETYRSMEDIVSECQMLAAGGVKEIMLLGQIVNNYGQGILGVVDNKSPFVQLLEKINGVHDLNRIRYMSPHPKGFKEDLITAHAELAKLCPSVHLPIQSGSDRILHAMKRPYSRERVGSIIEKLRTKVPDLSITTDIIVGYPGETEEDFQETVSLFEEIRFNMAFIFKYSARAGTISADLHDDVTDFEKDRRNKILLDIVQKHSIEYNRNMVGHEVEILVDGHAKRGDEKLCGRTLNGYKVIFDGPDDLIGQIVHRKILDHAITVLYG